MQRHMYLNIVKQAMMDVLETVNLIYLRHKRSMLDYAVWYQENMQSTSTYEDFITLVAAHCIVHANLIAPDVDWTQEMVQFQRI